MWNSSTYMSGSPFCRQAATIAPSTSEGSYLAILGSGITGIGGQRKNSRFSVSITRFRTPRARTR
jgi:hypothetical protein